MFILHLNKLWVLGDRGTGSRLAADWQQHWAALAANRLAVEEACTYLGHIFGGQTHENGPYEHENGKNGPCLKFKIAYMGHF